MGGAALADVVLCASGCDVSKQTDDERAAAICPAHVDPTQMYATNPPQPVYRPGWEICEKVDIERTTREREAKDKSDMEFLKSYVH